jgi:hypothetical protein
MISLGGKHCIIFSLTLGYPWNSSDLLKSFSIVKHLCDKFPAHNGLKEGVLSQFILKFPFEYVIREFQGSTLENRLNLLAETPNIMKRNTEPVLEFREVISIEVSAGKAKYTYHYQNAR